MGSKASAMKFISIAEPQFIFCKVTVNQRAIYYPDLGKNYHFFGFCYCGADASANFYGSNAPRFP